MKLLIDTNVIIDVFIKREPHYFASAEVLKLSEKRNVTLAVMVSQTTDICYILHRNYSDAVQARHIVRLLGDNMTVTDVTAADYRTAVNSDIADFEDALLASCAKRIKADYIITRNLHDFAQSTVPAVSPDDFLTQHFPREDE